MIANAASRSQRTTSPASTPTPAPRPSSAPAGMPTSPVPSTQRHPVLVDRSDGQERKTWPVRYLRMFDMTNDSHLFRTAAQLEAAGFYPVQGNRWKRGDELYLPLYQGRMIHQFDHRANSSVLIQHTQWSTRRTTTVIPAQWVRREGQRQASTPIRIGCQTSRSSVTVPACELRLDARRQSNWTLGFKADHSVPQMREPLSPRLFPASRIREQSPAASILRPETGLPHRRRERMVTSR